VIRIACEKAVSSRRAHGVGVGAAGAVDIERGIVLYAPNLGWKDVPLAKQLNKRLGVDVYWTTTSMSP